MNYAGKFGSGGLDSSSAAHLDLDSLSHRVNGDTVTVPDAHLLFSGDFARSGRDLVISDATHRFVVQNYFDVHKRPALVSPDGAPLDPRVVDALTGHVEYAQAAGAPAAKVVGNIVKMTGSASVVRNGVTVVLNNGDAIYQGDVVQTGSGSTIGLVLIDGTAFNLTANARLMLNDLTYDANSSSNSSLLTLVQGAASFVAGQVAKTGDMKVATPVATMGIRGTAVILDISAIDGKVSVSVMDQGDGQVHSVQVYTPNAAGVLVLIGTVTSSGGGLTLTPTATFEVIAEATNKTPGQIATEFNAFQQLLSTYDAGKQLIPSLPQHTENKGGGDKDSTSPATTTKFASSTPANPTAPEYHPPAGSPTVAPTNTQSVPIVVTSSFGGGSGGTGGTPGSGTSPTDSIPPVVKTVTFTPIPFVVTPPTVASITADGGDHTAPVMSASGNVVYDPDGVIYFYDRISHTTTRVTPNDGHTYTGQTISSDGRYVVYQSDGNPGHVYAWGTDPSDTAHYHQQTLIGVGGAPAVSGDGQTILVELGGKIGIYDLDGHLKGTISAAAVNAAGNLWLPSISADGHIIAFWNSDTGAPGGPGHLYVYDKTTATYTEIASVANGAGNHTASISADGHFVVYEGVSAAGRAEIYLYNLDTHQVVFSTESVPGLAAGASRNPVISPDGHYIIFTSDARLTAADGNGFADTYLVDVTNPSAPVFRLVSEGSNGASDGGVAISAGGAYVAFASNSSFSSGGATSNSNIFFADPTSGRSAIIEQKPSSPQTLSVGGVIAITGGVDGVTLAVTDTNGNPTSLLTASLNAGSINWAFAEAKSDFSGLAYGQDAVKSFIITMSSTGGTTTIPVTITIHNSIQPTITAVNAPPVAVPIVLTMGAEDGSYVITPAALLAGVSDVDGPSLTITSVTVESGGGSVAQDISGNWIYTPATNYNGPVVFNYAATDGSYSTGSTATVTLAPVNDAPEVTTGSGDSAGATIPETNDTLAATGTLTVSDIDGNDVVTVSVSGITHTGPTGGLSDATLKGYFSVPPTAVLNSGQTSAHFGWSFDSKGQHFDFLNASETLTLHYTITPDDGHAPAGTGDDVVTITISGSNDAPTLQSAALAPVAAGTANPSGQLISALFAGKFSDVDDGASFGGIAVVGGSPSAQGSWQYSYNGTAWHDFADEGPNAALLPADAYLRFVPANGFTGTPTALTVYGFDDTVPAGAITDNGHPQVVDLNSTGPMGQPPRGGSTPWAQDAVTITTSVTAGNHAPTLDSAGLESIPEDTPAGSIAGATVAELFGPQFSDPDGGDIFGVAVSANHATAAEGAWQYKNTDTGLWEDIGSPDLAHALAFSADTLLRFVPAADFFGTPGSLEVYAIDETYDEEFTVGSDPGGERYTINLTTDGDEPLGHGGTTPFSQDAASLTTSVTPVNDAPVFTGDSLGSTSTGGANVAIVANVVAEDVDSDDYSDGSLTATVTAGGHTGDTLRISDTGYIALQGNTVLYDSSGNGLSYVAIGTLTDNINSLTIDLNGSATDEAVSRLASAISFENTLPSPEAGTRTVTFTLQDGGGTAHGGHDSSYFTAEVTIPAPQGNHAPVLQDFTFTFDPGGEYIYAAVSGHYSDADGENLAGLAISHIDADPFTEGVWQYSDGTVPNPVPGEWPPYVPAWHDIPTDVSEAHAFTVNYATQLRFVPVGNYTGMPSITAYALDSNLGQSSGSPFVYIDVTSHGGETHISNPALISGAPTTNEDVPLTLSLQAGSMQPAIIIGPAHGSLTHHYDGSVSYTPDPEFSGTDTFTYSHSTTQTTDNLIVNPGAELGPDIVGEGFGPTPQGWTAGVGYLTAVDYTSPTFGLDGTSIGGGHAFFSGGPASVVSSISQVIDVSAYSTDIDAGTMTANLSGYLGGYYGQDDNITVTVHFLDAGNADLGNVLDIGPVLSSDRPFGSSLAYVSDSIAVPVGTQHISVLVTSTKTNSSYNDGYADNLSLTLSHGGEQSEPTVVHVTVNPVNDAPEFSGDAAGVTSEAGATVAIATNVSASDVDSDTYSGGTFEARIIPPFHLGDVLSIADVGGIQFSSDEIRYNGVYVGALSSAGNERDLVISLSTGATDEAIAALSQAITFSSTNGEAGPRDISFTLVDGGGESAQFIVAVDVTAQENHGPTIDATNWIERVSVRTGGDQANNHSANSSVSADGSLIVFQSEATNLVDDDTNGNADIFVFDQHTGVTERVSLGTGNTQSAGYSFAGAAITANGNDVVFVSDATDLVAGTDSNGANDVFFHDRTTGNTLLVSADDNGNALNGASGSTVHSISDDGQFVVFETTAAIGGDDNGTWDIYVRDLVGGTTTLVSADSTGHVGGGASNYAVISGDGRFVAFNSAVDDLDGSGIDSNGHRDVFVRDLLAGTTTLVSDPTDGSYTDSSAYAISGDGRYVLYTADPDGSNGSSMDLWVRDTQAGDAIFVTEATQGGISSADISADGRYVVYSSGNDGGGSSVYVFDTQAQLTMRVSQNADGEYESTIQNDYPAISADGRFVTFESYANLVPDDDNGFNDVFVVDLAAPARIIHDRTDGSPLAAFGLVLFSDDDAADTHTATVTPVGSGVGTFELEPTDVTELNGHGSVHWDFQVDHASVAYLAAGETLTQSYQVRIDDSAGGHTVQTVDVTIVGVNDAAEVDLDSGNPGLDYSATVLTGGGTVAIAAAPVVTDVDTMNLAFARVILSEGGKAGDYFTVAGQSAASGDLWNGIHWEITGTPGGFVPLMVTLSGDNPPSDYADAIAQVAFGTTSSTVGQVDITVTVFDGDAHSYPAISHIEVTAPGNHAPVLEDTSWITRVSVNNAGDEGNAISASGAVSSTGVVVFSSDADNLADEDVNHATDIFIRDLQGNFTERVSVSSNGTEASGSSLDGPSISADGNFVAFQSSADNLVPGDNNNIGTVYLHNVADGTTQMVSVDNFGNQLNTESLISNHAVSDDGRYVVFETQAGIASEDQNHTWDIYVRDTVENVTTLVSAYNHDVVPGSDPSDYGVISGNGLFVAFNSAVDGLDGFGFDANGFRDVLVRDLYGGNTILVSDPTDTTYGNSAAYGISSTGQYVLYTSEVVGSSGFVDLIIDDIYTQHRTVVGRIGIDYFTTADISADGRHVVYTNATPEGGVGVYVYDAATHITMLVSTNALGDAGEATSEYPAISANGRFVTFQSNDGNFDPSDGNNVNDVFVVDLAAPTRVIHDTTDGSTLAAFGLVAFSDEDLSDVLDVSFEPLYGGPGANFEIDPVVTGINGHGSVHWSFQIDHSAVAYLTEGDEATFAYNVIISDGTDQTTQTIEISVTGVNDAASVDLDENEPGLGHTGTLYVGGDPVAISTGAQVTDADSDYISSATVVLASGWMAGDYFTVGGSSGPSGFFNNIQWEITGDGGVDSPLTITFFSGGTPADYSDAIAAVSFGSSSTTEHSVDIAVTLDDGDKLSSPVISHIDVVVSTDNIWTGAASNDWNLPQNWSLDRIPTLADNVTINDATVQVEIADDQYSINQLTLASPGFGQLELDISGTSYGGFTVASALSNEGVILVQYTNFNAPGTVLNHGIIEAAGQNSVLNFVSATIDHADGEGELVASGAGKISLIDTTVDTGSIEVYDESQAYVSGSTLAGVDLITLGSGIVTIAASSGVGSSTTTFDGSGELFLNEASVNVESGATLNLLGSIDNQGGSIQVSAGAEARFIDATVQGGEIGAYGAQAHIVMQGSTFVGFDLAAGYGGLVTIAAAPSGQSSITTFDGTGGFTIEEGDITIEAGATLNLIGSIFQYGTITVDPAMQPGTITITGVVELTGGGTIVLEDPNGSVITSAPGQTGTLSINDDNKILGTGQLGAGNLNINVDNTSAEIIADSEGRLFIDTGTGYFVNHGHIISEAAGGIDIAGAISNESDGLLIANAGLFEIHGAVSGAGRAWVGAGTLQFDAASDAAVNFNPLDFRTGTLVLGDIEEFTGTITGYSYGDTIHVIGHMDLNLHQDVDTGDLLLGVVSTGQYVSLGNYMSGAFTMVNDGVGGTNLVFNQRETTSDALLSPDLSGVGSALPGTIADGSPGIEVIGVSADGVNFVPVTAEAAGQVDGTYLHFQAQSDGSTMWSPGVPGFGDAHALIASIEANETQFPSLSDTFYYKVLGPGGNIWIDTVHYRLSDLTFGGVGQRTLGVAHGETLSLGELAVHDWGNFEGATPSIIHVTVTVGFGELSLAQPPQAAVSVSFSEDHHSVTIHGTEQQINDTLNTLQFTSATAGHTDILISGVDGPVATSSYYAGTIAVDDVAPAAIGDMAVITAIGHSAALTTADLNVIDPDDPNHDNLIFTVIDSDHGHLRHVVDWTELGPGSSFTLADIEAGRIFYQAPADYTGQDHIRLRLSDNVSTVPTVFVNLGATVVDAQLTVLTTNGYDFVGENPAIVMGNGDVVPDANDPDASFTIYNTDAGRKFIYSGSDFAYSGNVVTAGRVVSITEMDLSDNPLARLDINVDAAAWYAAIVAKAAGDNAPLEAVAEGWQFFFAGNSGSDNFDGGDLNDYFAGRAGNDTFLGRFGYDRASYANATDIVVDLAAGTVTGTTSGTDTLDSIEMITGSPGDDVFSAVGFSATSQNAGSTVANNVAGTFNEFEGGGGYDTITGNGSTRISYYHATAGVTVTFNEATSWSTSSSGASGTATGNDSVRTDTFSGVNAARLSFFDDTVTGSTNPLGTVENFEGLGGDDHIDGGGGFDRAHYNLATDGVGIDVQLAAGIVTGGVDTGTDTLLSVEGIWGTEYDDVYDATGFTAADVPSPSANAGSVQNQVNPAVLTNFNEFEGGGGNDTITGNGNTRIAFYHADSGVMVQLGYGATHGVAIGSSIGVDDIVGGVNRVRLSEFNDIVYGSINNEVFEGQGGNDVLKGGGGFDLFTGGTGADTFVFDAVGGLAASGNVLTINDFHGHGSEGDRIDLRNLPGITSFGQLVFNDFSGNAEITFGPGNLAKIILIGVSSSSLTASDFIIGNQVNVQVQTPDGYDFSSLYDDMAASDPQQAANDSEHVFAVNTAKGITFELIGTGFDYSLGPVPTAGTINEIHILNTTNPADFTDLAAIHSHTLVDSDGWAIDAWDMFTAIGNYGSIDSGIHALGLASLNTIFNSARYSVAGASGFVTTDTLGHSGNDVLFGGDNADTFVGLSGNDTVDYSHATAAVTVSLATPASNTGAAAGDLYNGIENLRTTDYADTLTGNGNNNVLEGGPGGDALVGGGGIDTASYQHAAAAVYVDLATPGNNTGEAAGDSYNSIENILGSSYDDTLTGDNNNNTIEGGAGNDIIIGGGGNNAASYEHATAGVVVNLSLSTAQNTVGAGTDTLSEIQNLYGSYHNDVLIGSSSDNMLIGMGGHDTFVFNIGAAGGIGHDTIGDFSPGEDYILLDDAVFDTSGPNDFSHWIATHATSQNSGQDTLIDFDPLGHPGQQTLLLKNVVIANLHANDFILPAGGLTA